MCLKVILYNYSKDSDDDNTIIVKPLRWWSNLVNTLFANFDAKTMEEKSPQAIRQLKAHVTGLPSSRGVSELQA